MKNYVQPGANLTVPAPSGGVVAGQAVLIGSLFGVAQGVAAATAPVTIVTEGVFDLPKVASQAWTVGTPVFWDPAAASGAGALTSTAGSLKRVGVAVAPVADGAGDTIGRVKLIGVPVN